MLPWEFFVAGKAEFTVSNPQGDHYTYRIDGPKSEGQPFFISVLVFSERRQDYVYIGVFDPAGGAVRLTRASKFTEGSKVVRVARWALHHSKLQKELPPGYKVAHVGKCGRCGRKLTHPESIERGLGPECATLGGAAP